MTDVRPIPPKFVHHGPVKQVGILGGSIAGCAVAAELSRAGYAVTVLEVRGEEPKDRGAGIGLPLSLVKTLVEHDLIDAETPHLDVHVFRHVVRDEREEAVNISRIVEEVPVTDHDALRFRGGAGSVLE